MVQDSTHSEAQMAEQPQAEMRQYTGSGLLDSDAEKVRVLDPMPG